MPILLFLLLTAWIGSGVHALCQSLVPPVTRVALGTAAAPAFRATAATDAPSPTKVSKEWVPDWLPKADLEHAAAWQAVALAGSLGCNSTSFASDKALGDTYIARKMNSSACSPTSRWSLAWAHMDWSRKTITFERDLLDTSGQPVPIGDGHEVRSALDPVVASWGGEEWVAFICVPGFHIIANCVGPLRSDRTLDMSRTAVVVTGVDDGTFEYSAGVPKLLPFKGRLYLYWTMVKIDKASRAFVKLTVRGTQLEQEASGQRRLYAVGHPTSPARTNDASTVEVFGVDPKDRTANQSADIYQVLSDGNEIYFTGARGGGGCVSPANAVPGCYRLTIGRTTSPLKFHTFNAEMIPDRYLPPNANSYARFVYRPEDGRTILLVGRFHNPGALADVPAGARFIVWPTNLFP